jgi:hypothetical protein
LSQKLRHCSDCTKVHYKQQKHITQELLQNLNIKAC